MEGASGDVGKVCGDGGVLVAAKVGHFYGQRCRVTLRRPRKRNADGGELAWFTSRQVTSWMWAPARRWRRAHEDGDNQQLDAAVIDGVVGTTQSRGA
jgi:hypothetical protein